MQRGNAIDLVDQVSREWQRTMCLLFLIGDSFLSEATESGCFVWSSLTTKLPGYGISGEY